jgi:hypothetical protein
MGLCRHPARIRALWTAIALAAALLPAPIVAQVLVDGQGIFNRLFQSKCTERCGLFGMSVEMREGTPGTDSCVEYCVLFPTPGMTCGNCDVQSFEIELGYGGIPESDRGFFANAKARWESIIVGDVPDRRVLLAGGRGGIPGCDYPRRIDDLYICGVYAPIDGRGRILGSAGPSILRKDGGIPAAGFMEFDVDDVARMIERGGFSYVILHEMAHVLGTLRWIVQHGIPLYF